MKIIGAQNTKIVLVNGVEKRKQYVYIKNVYLSVLMLLQGTEKSSVCLGQGLIKLNITFILLTI